MPQIPYLDFFDEKVTTPSSGLISGLMGELRIFWDLASQPCRAVCLFLEENQIPYKSVNIDLAKG